MLAVIQRHRSIFIVLVLVTLLAILSWFVFKPGANKIPSRGVFVVNTIRITL